MKCIVLQNSDEVLLGFILFSPDLGEPQGDCVFVISPGQSELSGSPVMALLVERREAFESEWQLVGRTPLSVVIRTPGLPKDLFIDLESSGTGFWGVIERNQRQAIGRALLPVETNK